MVLLALDLRTLTDFRRVNQKAMEMVDALYEYATIATYTRNALQGVLSIELGRWISCLDLYDKIRATKCEGCGDAAGYIYLLALKRLCYRCVSCREPILEDGIQDQYDPREEELAMLPRMKSVQGHYSPLQEELMGGLSVFDGHAIAELGCDPTRSKEPPWLNDPSWRHAPSLLSLHGFLAAVRVPLLDPTSKVVDWGFYCRGCEKLWNHKRKLFNPNIFKDLLIEWGEISHGTHLNEELLRTPTLQFHCCLEGPDYLDDFNWESFLYEPEIDQELDSSAQCSQ